MAGGSVQPGMVSATRAAVAVRRNGGPMRTRDLRRQGVSKSDLASAVRTGLLVRPRNGIYCLPETSPAILESLSHCGLVACVTASREYGLWTLDLGEDEGVHTWVDPDHRPVRIALHPDEVEPDCCVFHRDTAIDPADRGRVGIVHALRQLLRCRGAECFFAALESALRQGLIDDTQRATLRGLAEPRRSLARRLRSHRRRQWSRIDPPPAAAQTWAGAREPGTRPGGRRRRLRHRRLPDPRGRRRDARRRAPT